MSAQKFLRFQCHEFDGHFHLVRDGLKPYYQLTNVRKNHDWSADGKPTGTFEAGGETWRVCLDYDDQPIVPWDAPQYRLETAYLYRVYFVCEDETYDGERADRSQRVKGGTITFRPRWPDMKRREKADDDGDGEWNGPITDVDGYMDLGVPYVDAQVQGSNIDFDRYSQLLAEAAAAFGIPRRYFHEFHRTSNVTDEPTVPVGETLSTLGADTKSKVNVRLAVLSTLALSVAVTVTGIVRGENATIETEDQPIHVRNSTLSLALREQNASQATIRVTLRDAQTGDPIGLNDSTISSSDGRIRTGYISIADQQVQTNRSGVAIVRVDQPGMYTAQYHPGSWVSHEPAYVGSTAAVRWHPLTTIDGWFRLLLRTGLQLLPFAVMLYAGIRLRRMLGPDEFFDS